MKKLTLILGLIVLMVVSYLGYNYFSNPTTDNSNDFVIRNTVSTAQTKTTTSAPETQTQTTVKPKPVLTTTEVKTLIQSTPAFSAMPQDSIVALGFWDGNGIPRSDLVFTIYGNGDVKNSLDPNYDFKITTGDYYIENIKSTNNLCASLKDIKSKQDYGIDRKISAFSATLKYRGLLQYKDCLA
ncbi:MAG: hypothetical protein PHD81_04895 [Candidatus Nanoarchaeia archaeon]|nr:hypothetical protein [Candidatus Nanoarchaeia archaeon]MDD5588415.1 hypothetical protein [Candidatus Nanoarchaeia archaeon]